MQLSNKELYRIFGGASGITATLLNSIIRGFSFIFDLGKSIGSSLRRGIDGKTCSY